MRLMFCSYLAINVIAALRKSSGDFFAIKPIVVENFQSRTSEWTDHPLVHTLVGLKNKMTKEEEEKEKFSSFLNQCNPLMTLYIYP